MNPSLFEDDYFSGKTSNYLFGYHILDHKIGWYSRIKKILKYKKSGKLLDFGCAYGYLLKYARKYFDVYGFDISHHAITIAKNVVGPERVKEWDISCGIPFDFKFDVVTAFDVLEHVPDQQKVLEDIYNSMNHGGFLFIEMPLKCDKNPNRLKDKDVTHIHVPTYNEVISSIKKTRFEIVDETNQVDFGFGRIKSKKPRNAISLVLKK